MLKYTNEFVFFESIHIYYFPISSLSDKGLMVVVVVVMGFVYYN